MTVAMALDDGVALGNRVLRSDGQSGELNGARGDPVRRASVSIQEIAKCM